MLGATLLTTLVTAQGPASRFQAGHGLQRQRTGEWTVVGDGAWTADKGEVTGKAGPGGSWLVLDRPYQDLNFFSRFQCSSPCDAGVLFRVQATRRRTDRHPGLAQGRRPGRCIASRSMPAGRVTTREPLRAVGPFLRSALPANHPMRRSRRRRSAPAAAARQSPCRRALPTSSRRRRAFAPASGTS